MARDFRWQRRERQGVFGQYFPSSHAPSSLIFPLLSPTANCLLPTRFSKSPFVQLLFKLHFPPVPVPKSPRCNLLSLAAWEKTVMERDRTRRLEALFDHLVLPPKLPGSYKDNDVCLTQDLGDHLRLACYSLHLTGDKYIWKSLAAFAEATRKINQGSLSKEDLLSAFEDLSREGTGDWLALHVVQQNVALLIHADHVYVFVRCVHSSTGWADCNLFQVTAKSSSRPSNALPQLQSFSSRRTLFNGTSPVGLWPSHSPTSITSRSSTACLSSLNKLAPSRSIVLQLGRQREANRSSKLVTRQAQPLSVKC